MRRNNRLKIITLMITIILFCCNPLNIIACTKAISGSSFYEESRLPQIQIETDETMDSSGDNSFKWLYITIGIVATIVLAIIVCIFVLHKKRKSKRIKDNKKQNNEQISDGEKNNTEKTDISDSNLRRSDKNVIYVKKRTSDVPPTMMLWKITIRLTNVNDDKEVYEYIVDNTTDFANVHIGRGKTQDVDIRINDGAVSDIHCEIIKKGNLYYIRDLNSTNGTKYNNQKVCGEVPITDKGMLKIGQKMYCLEIIDCLS